MRKLTAASLAGVALLAIGCGGGVKPNPDNPTPKPPKTLDYEIEATFHVCDIFYNSLMRRQLDENEGIIQKANPIVSVQRNVHDQIEVFYSDKRTFEQAQAVVTACRTQTSWHEQRLPGVSTTPTSL